jgi:hypothetical protein
MKKSFATLLLSLCMPFSSLLAQSGAGGIGSNTNNVLWLDANRGISLATSNVITWADQSGNANNATPFAVANRPTYVTNSVNGYPSLSFDGTNDELRVADNATLDLTQWHIFLVVRVALQKNFNAWLVKGNNAQENYEILSYSDGNIHNPIFFTDATRTFTSSPAGQVTTTEFSIIEYSYSSAVGRDVYKNNQNIVTDNNSKTPTTNNFELYIGNERNTTGRYINGSMAEVVMYSNTLNNAQRIIINNYLAAKYDITLSSQDIYTQDNVLSGNYDHEVAGIGRVDASNIQNDSQGSGIVRIRNPNNLDNNEFLIWGHDNAQLAADEAVDVPTGVQARLNRVWRASEVNVSGGAVNVGAIDMRWDLANLGNVNPTDLRLLVDTDNDGIFSDETPISGATLVSGSTYQFAGVTAIANNTRFTLATINSMFTPLPIELVKFDAFEVDKYVKIIWQTISETNNDFFTIEKSKEGKNWEKLGIVKGAGNSSQLLNYNFNDTNPYFPISYYRLKQNDYDGNYKYSYIKSVNINSSEGGSIKVYPNPVVNQVILDFSYASEKATPITVYDLIGKEVTATIKILEMSANKMIVDLSLLPVGVYILKTQSNIFVIYKE